MNNEEFKTTQKQQSAAAAIAKIAKENDLMITAQILDYDGERIHNVMALATSQSAFKENENGDAIFSKEKEDKLEKTAEMLDAMSGCLAKTSEMMFSHAEDAGQLHLYTVTRNFDKTVGVLMGKPGEA